METTGASRKKPAYFIGSALADLRRFSEDVQDEFGKAILKAQWGGKAVQAKPLKGFGGAGVLEIVAEDDGSTFRAVYTVRFAGAVYVLHVFQKKSNRGIATAPHDTDTVRRRLRAAEEHYAEQFPSE
jgi:phage-related protein